MDNERRHIIKERFGADFATYDKKVRDVLPHYDEMQSQFIETLNWPQKSRLSVLDLGMGTGNTASEVLKKYPNAEITGVDLSPQMMEVAKKRLHDKLSQITMIEGDMSDFEPTQDFDACVGVLSIHHLTGEKKKALYKKIFQHLNGGGIFAIGDLRIGDSEDETKKLEKEWEDHLVSKFGVDGAHEWLTVYRTEDMPESVSNQIEWLDEVGFQTLLQWKRGNLALIIGRKM